MDNQRSERTGLWLKKKRRVKAETPGNFRKRISSGRTPGVVGGSFQEAKMRELERGLLVPLDDMQTDLHYFF